MARTRFRLTLKTTDAPDAPEVFSDVVWAEEQMQSSAPGGVVLVWEKNEHPEVTELYKQHGTLVASWQPV